MQGKAFQNGCNTTLHGPHLKRNVFPKPFGARRTSPMVSARSSILTLRDGDYQKEVKADERQSISKPTPKPKEYCHICEDEIDPGDVAVCGGGGKPDWP